MARVIGNGVDYNDVLIVPKYNKVASRREVDFTTSATRKNRIRLPILSANMDSITDYRMAIALGRLGGLGVIHRFMDIDEEVENVKKVKQQDLVCAASIGIKDYQQRAKALVDAGVDILVIDIAHGHSKQAGKTLDWLVQEFPDVDYVAGNIATKDAAEYFLSKRADAVKVGIGPGKACLTRQMTGVGVPQLTAIMDVYEATQGRIPIIADGGIENPSDVVKALGAGASSVMCGYVFAGCEECAMPNTYRGSASEKVKGDVAFVEGREVEIKPQGPVEGVVRRYLDGIASGMTYCGKSKLEDFIGKADFILRGVR